MNGFVKLITEEMRVQQLRNCSNYVNRMRTFEWLKNDDDALRVEFMRGRFLLFLDKHPLLRRQSKESQDSKMPQYALAWLNFDAMKNAGLAVSPDQTTLLGVVSSDAPRTSPKTDKDDWLPLFGVGLKSEQISNGGDRSSVELSLKGEFADLRRAMFIMDRPVESQYLAKAQSLLRWSHSFKHCPKCGHALKAKLSKAMAVCINCAQIHYPTTSPVTICLISDAARQHALLVRQPRHMQGVFTAVAGFSEIGEALEDTVRREVAEEVGMEVTDIKYADHSQHWPYPQSSLMCGFYAVANRSQEPKVDRSELEDAHWFTRDQVRQAFERTRMDPYVFRAQEQVKTPFTYVPPVGTIANYLIQHWLSM